MQVFRRLIPFIVDTYEYPVWVIDSSATIVAFNRAAAGFAGLPAGELPGSSFAAALYSKRDSGQSPLLLTLQKGVEFNNRLYYVMTDALKESVLMRVTTWIHRGEDGEVDTVWGEYIYPESSPFPAQFMDHIQVTRAFGEAIGARDPYTRGHCLRVGCYARLIGRRMGFSCRELANLTLAAAVHDVGKIGVPDYILTKPGPLTPAEFSLIKTHPERAVQILKHIEFYRDILAPVLQHHERVDGSGYPCGLNGGEICPEALILSVADAFEAMTSRRSYRRALSPAEAAGELLKNAGTQFDPLVVEFFISVLDEAEVL
ncbi:MAG: HD domain-containing protein [Peptococcaceae bacterium]|nr:HD domain-containing protein [Peptococcaceae bacterium]